MHGTGLGAQTMRETERIAALPPLNATALALDTMTDAVQRSELCMRLYFDDLGLPRPQKLRTNEEWYKRQGYQVMHIPNGVGNSAHVFKAYVGNVNDPTVEGNELEAVWMIKSI